MRIIFLIISLTLLSGTASAKKNDFAKVNAQFSELEEKIRQMHGEIEHLNHRIDMLNNTLEKSLKDIEFRFQEQNKVPANPRDVQFYEKDQPVDLTPKKQTPPIEAKPQQKEESKPQEKEDESVTKLYESGIAYMRAAQYEKAEDALYNFIQKYPKNELASNAYYWLGETFFVRNLFEQSAVYFLKGYQNFPKGDKASDNLYKLAVTFSQMNKTKESCASFDKLLKEFPKLSNDMKEQVIIEKAKAKC
jgi:tol-pal system protein YbgF